MTNENGEWIICEDTGKRCYSKRDAETTINRAKGHKQKRKRPCRKYFCEYCNYYHLTSMPYENHYSNVKKKKRFIKHLYK